MVCLSPVWLPRVLFSKQMFAIVLGAGVWGGRSFLLGVLSFVGRG